ncbi:AAA family ATPase [Sedimentibacter sp. zth1]|uniref:ATP-dependent nuclease n=1 Tax=Sedimentibacter sp. zth1 TaxID=2816908 RepID=UPI001A915074|nr:AAA family ATPase [Sedimentibacter sp. zth1]QSX04789.1 AAA family ATPase [Sedimentibacter sp. zth1]
MYLKSLSIINFRKFGEIDKDNTIEFIDAEDYKKSTAVNNKVNIAQKTTLIVGKNNSGKTTVTEALNKLINETKFKAEDFNFNYLKNLLEKYKKHDFKEIDAISCPYLKFVIIIGIDNNNEDLVTNIIPFMSLEDVKKSEVEIIVKYEVKDSEIYIKDLEKFLAKDYKSQEFDRFLYLINKTEFQTVYYNSANEKRNIFSLNKLIELTPIKAINIKNNNCLSKAFQKIIEYRYNIIIDEKIVDKLDDEILKINNKLSKDIKKNHSDDINKSLSKVILSEKCKVLLKSDLTFQKLIQSVIKYEYVEGNNNIPEQQFGLGYTHLMMIVADIITYMEKYPESSFNSKVNLISIEEPETFMHPQMQEQFIKYIDDMISALLESKNKHVNSQIIITTHSSHILNSKIHSGNTFNNINYITTVDGIAKSVSLNDDKIIDIDFKSEDEEKITKYELNFLKKHIKYKVSELFFSDAVIFVEGITEYTLLQYYIDENSKLNQYYISAFLIDGAHAKVYAKLIDILNVPSLIITDIDIKRSKKEKGEEGFPEVYKQINTLCSRITTNETIKFFYDKEKLCDIVKSGYIELNNLKIIFQKNRIKGYYSTSFEEAFILTNSDNKILNNVLKDIKPDIYKNIIKNGGLINNSYKLQVKLSNSKSRFANSLLYNILTCESNENIPKLPKYIVDGFKFLENRLGGK